MKIALGCDHGGIGLKDEIVPLLQELGHTVDDNGCYSTDSVDYPDFAKAVCAQVQNGSCERGILICGTGVGMSMVANVLCLGARVVGPGLAVEIVRTWVCTEFAGGRHQRRIEMF